jgi:hypothetical protein
MTDLITLPRATVQQALHVATAAGYPVALIAALRAALEQPTRAQKMRDAGYTRRPTLREMAEPEQEPVAWLSIDCIGERYLCFSKPLDNDPVQPLYTHPPRREWRGLTTAEIDEISDRIERSNFFDIVIPFARAVEAALRSKNHE